MRIPQTYAHFAALHGNGTPEQEEDGATPDQGSSSEDEIISQEGNQGERETPPPPVLEPVTALSRSPPTPPMPTLSAYQIASSSGSSSTLCRFYYTPMSSFSTMSSVPSCSNLSPEQPLNLSRDSVPEDSPTGPFPSSQVLHDKVNELESDKIAHETYTAYLQNELRLGQERLASLREEMRRETQQQSEIEGRVGEITQATLANDRMSNELRQEVLTARDVFSGDTQASQRSLLQNTETLRMEFQELKRYVEGSVRSTGAKLEELTDGQARLASLVQRLAPPAPPTPSREEAQGVLVLPRVQPRRICKTGEGSREKPEEQGAPQKQDGSSKRSLTETDDKEKESQLATLDFPSSDTTDDSDDNYAPGQRKGGRRSKSDKKSGCGRKRRRSRY